MTCRMTQGHLMISIGMALLRGDTTQSSTHGTQQIEIDFEIDHGQFERKLAGSSTKENRSTARRLIMPWSQECSSTSSHPTCLKIMKKSLRM
jgi:hypothetical protein